MSTQGSGGRYPTGGYTGLGTFDQQPPRPDRRGAKIAGLILTALVVVSGAFGLIWRLHDSTEPGSAEAAAPLSDAANSDANTGPLSAYRVGTCLYEVPGESPDSVTLQTTGCDSDDAVFTVNQVVGESDGCSRFADYAHYGLVQADSSAHVVYCLSLAVPVKGCVHLAGGSAPQRAKCGSGDASQVVEIRDAKDPTTACTGLSDADPWYDRSPASGRIACLVKGSG
ncbi:MAG: LppU/SCO3897 family protein [Sciscionella sp.]